MNDHPPSRILVVGLGSIGGVISAHLLKNKCDVLGVTTNQSILDHLNRDGFTLLEAGRRWSVAGTVLSSPPDDQKFDYIFLATQPPQAEVAAKKVASLLSDDGVFVCFQNGLMEARLADVYGPQKLVGGVIAWGASMPNTGVYQRTSTGGFTLGRLAGEADVIVHRLATILETVGPVTVTDNLAGARWSKLAINCAISSLGTISGQRLGALLANRHARRLALEIITETVMVAHAEGVRLTHISRVLDLDWLALNSKELNASFSWNAFVKHLVLMLVGLKHRRLRSSMLQAIERGRAPSVDFLNGEVTKHGQGHGISTPINSAVVKCIHAISRKETEPSWATLRDLYRSTRGLLEVSTV